MRALLFFFVLTLPHYALAQDAVAKTSGAADVLVIETKESNDQYVDVVIGVEAIDYLERDFRSSSLKNYAQLLKQKGYSAEGVPEVTNSRVGSIDFLGPSVGVATVWLRSSTKEGDISSKYIFAAGVIGDTLHKVICWQQSGDDIMLMINPKCHDKLVEVFSAKP